MESCFVNKFILMKCLFVIIKILYYGSEFIVFKKKDIFGYCGLLINYVNCIVNKKKIKK